MSKNVTWFLIALMGLSLIGLMGVQYFWVKESYELKNQQFQQSVAQSLRNIVYKVDKERMMLSLKRRGQSRNPLLNQFINPLIEDSLNQKKPDWAKNLDRHLNHRLRLFQDMFETFSPGLWQQQSLKPKKIDSIIANEFNDAGVKTEYEYALLKNNRLSYISSKEHLKRISKTQYRVNLYPKSIGINKTLLLITFPQQSSFIIKQLGLMLVLSFILLSFIVFCFSFAINIILKQRQLAEMKTDFINNMTHELKTPIATISLASEALQEEDVLKEKSKRNRFLNVIKEENERLKVQVEKVLSFAKVDKNELKLNKSELDVHELIEKVVSSFELIIKEKKAQLSFDYKANNKVFMGDESHMNNILRNLIDNALKYSLGSPRVKIKTRNVSNGIEISISDNGLGISAEDQAKVFEKFFRVHTGNKHDVKGFGLGLSYVQKMIQLHKGNIKVKSQLNKGSEFIIYLPYGI